MTDAERNEYCAALEARLAEAADEIGHLRFENKGLTLGQDHVQKRIEAENKRLQDRIAKLHAAIITGEGTLQRLRQRLRGERCAQH